MTTKGGVVGHSAMCVLEALRPGPYDRCGEGQCRSCCRRTHPRRLRAALPRLRARYTEVRNQEDVAAWKADAEELAVRRDELRMEFVRIFPAS